MVLHKRSNFAEHNIWTDTKYSWGHFASGCSLTFSVASSSGSSLSRALGAPSRARELHLPGSGTAGRPLVVRTARRPGQTASQAGQTASQAGQTASQPGQTASQPGQTASQPGQTASQPGQTASQAGQAGHTASQPARPAFGWHYLSNATCLVRPHAFYMLFTVSKTTII